MEDKKKAVKSTLKPQIAKQKSSDPQFVKSPLLKVNNKVPLIKVNDKSPSRSLTEKDPKPLPVTPESDGGKLKLRKSPSNYTTPKRLYQKGDAAWPDMPPSLVKKGSWKKRPKPAHSGVPVPEKLRKLMENLKSKGGIEFLDTDAEI